MSLLSINRLLLISFIFRHSPTDGDALAASVRRDNNIVIAILDDMQKQLKEIEGDFASWLKGMLNNLERYRVQAITLHNALRPEERPYNASILDDIKNIDDFDHQ
jgi:hypothetical protein